MPGQLVQKWRPSLALVLGGYALASALHVSGPIAMVVAGLLIGNKGRSFAMSDTTRQHLDIGIVSFVKYFVNYFFYKFGLEVGSC